MYPKSSQDSRVGRGVARCGGGGCGASCRVAWRVASACRVAVMRDELHVIFYLAGASRASRRGLSAFIFLPHLFHSVKYLWRLKRLSRTKQRGMRSGSKCRGRNLCRRIFLFASSARPQSTSRTAERSSRASRYIAMRLSISHVRRSSSSRSLQGHGGARAFAEQGTAGNACRI